MNTEKGVAPVDQVRRFQVQNTLRGFGSGSRRQGDRRGSAILLGLDIAGTALTVSGSLGLAGSILMYNAVKATVGRVTMADIFIGAGVLVAGLLTLVVSKALGLRYPRRY